MLLNFHTIDACFLSSTIHIKSNLTFFLVCLLSFLLVISLEGLRRLQRKFDRYLQRRDSLVLVPLPQEDLQTENLLGKAAIEEVGEGKERVKMIVLEQLLRGIFHGVQFAVSYCVMLLFMYSNGYIMLSLVLGAMVGFALFTRDTIRKTSRTQDGGGEENSIFDDRAKVCC